MLKHLLNSSSLLAIAHFDKDSDERAALRNSLMNNNTSTFSKVEDDATEDDSDDTTSNDTDENGNEEDSSDEDASDEDEGDLTVEEKAAKEAEKVASDKAAAKAARKQDRMQRRIDEAVAAAKTAKDELAAFKASNPNSTLTEEEVEARAEAKAAEKLAAKRLEEINNEFVNSCDRLQKAATIVDKDFYEKTLDVSDQFGPIPSFMIGVLDDMDNGGEVLAHIVNDDELAEKLWKLSGDNKTARLTKELVILSDKLENEKKSKNKKQISNVPEPIAPVRGSRTTSTVITTSDTRPENMDNYVAKRRAQMEANKRVGR